MLIQMLETRRGSQDGFIVERFHEGQTYDVRHSLACQFLSRGWAVQVDASGDALDFVGKMEQFIAELDQIRANRLNADCL